jgi:hypothetical protein
VDLVSTPIYLSAEEEEEILFQANIQMDTWKKLRWLVIARQEGDFPVVIL